MEIEELVKNIRRERFERFNEKIIHIGDKDYSMDDFLVVIPEEYADIFRSVRFENRDEFNRALMFAHCAEAARYHKKPIALQENESALKWYLKHRSVREEI